METNTIDTAIGELGLQPVRTVACIGSGPTPFTSLCLQERYGPDVKFVNIDRDPEAVEMSSNLVQRCGIENVVFSQADAASLTDLRHFDLVHVAAMVGTSVEEKTDLVLSIAAVMRPKALMLVRSTDGLRRLLYPAFNADDERILSAVTPILATRYFGGATSLTAVVVQIDDTRQESGPSTSPHHMVQVEDSEALAR